MTFQEFCYELYKIDWESRITADQKLDNMRQYYNAYLEDKSMRETYGNYGSYLEEYGYAGEIYACFSEFMECEFQDLEYMRELLNDEKLIRVYMKEYITQNEYNPDLEEDYDFDYEED